MKTKEILELVEYGLDVFIGKMDPNFVPASLIESLGKGSEEITQPVATIAATLRKLWKGDGRKIVQVSTSAMVDAESRNAHAYTTALVSTGEVYLIDTRSQQWTQLPPIPESEVKPNVEL